MNRKKAQILAALACSVILGLAGCKDDGMTLEGTPPDPAAGRDTRSPAGAPTGSATGSAGGATDPRAAR